MRAVNIHCWGTESQSATCWANQGAAGSGIKSLQKSKSLSHSKATVRPHLPTQECHPSSQGGGENVGTRGAGLEPCRSTGWNPTNTEQDISSDHGAAETSHPSHSVWAPFPLTHTQAPVFALQRHPAVLGNVHDCSTLAYAQATDAGMCSSQEGVLAFLYSHWSRHQAAEHQ